MKNKQHEHYGGISFVGVLQVALIVLKLIGQIDWPWWKVWSPTWGSAALIVVIVIGVFIYAGMRQK